MPKYPKGILGVRKDPKKQILFSFRAREGEEWPSTDSDSDYLPDDDSEPRPSGSSRQSGSSKRKKGSKGKSPVKRVKRTSGESRSGTVRRAPTQVAITVKSNGVELHLPTEIWLKIFHYVVRSEGALPFLTRAGLVCQTWNDISSHLSLWQKVDLGYGWLKLSEQKFRWLCANRLTECTDLSLSNCTKIMNSSLAVKALTTHCLNLRVLNLSLCKKLSSDIVLNIVSSCKHLEDLDLSSSHPDAVSSRCLLGVIEKCGSQLRRLNVGNNQLRGFNSVFSAIMDKCPNLEALDLSSVKLSAGTLNVNVERFQQGCPKLKSLRLIDVILCLAQASQQVQQESPGFPELKEFSLGVIEQSGSMGSPGIITRFLKNADKLQMLDLRGCKCAAMLSLLVTLPGGHLEQLYLGRSGIETLHDLHHILSKLKDSLIDLDLSRISFAPNVLDSALMALTGANKLEILNLAGSPVTMAMLNLTASNSWIPKRCKLLRVSSGFKPFACWIKSSSRSVSGGVNIEVRPALLSRKVIPSLPALKDLDLTSCRDLPRGCKRQYKSRTEIESLDLQQT